MRSRLHAWTGTGGLVGRRPPATPPGHPLGITGNTNWRRLITTSLEHLPSLFQMGNTGNEKCFSYHLQRRGSPNAWTRMRLGGPETPRHTPHPPLQDHRKYQSAALNNHKP